MQPLETVRGLGAQLRALQDGGDSGGESLQLLLPDLPGGTAGVGTPTAAGSRPSSGAQGWRNGPPHPSHTPRHGEAEPGPGSPLSRGPASPRPRTAGRTPPPPPRPKGALRPSTGTSTPHPGYLACLRKLSAAAVNMPDAPKLLTASVRGQSGPPPPPSDTAGPGGTRCRCTKVPLGGEVPAGDTPH